MAEIVASNQDIERTLEALRDEVIAGGGVIHDRVRLCERDGDFSIEAPTDIGPREIIIAIPQNLLLPETAFDLRLEEDEISIGEPRVDVPHSQRRLMEISLNLFNETGKLAQYRTQSLFALEEAKPDLLGRLSLAPRVPKDQEPISGTPLLDRFLQTRVLTVPTDAGGRDLQRVLMPVIDLLNHEARAPGIVLHDGSLVATRGRPGEQGEETFICYGRYDAHDLLLNYGFLLESPSFVNAVPFELDLPSGHRIAVLRTGRPMNAARIPENLRDIGWIMPATNFDSGARSLMFHYLPMVTNAESDATRRMLRTLLGYLMIEHSPEEVEVAVALVIDHAVQASGDYYRGLLRDVEGSGEAPEAQAAIGKLKSMAELQINLISQFARAS